MNLLDDLTVVVCTLNEESNISDCLGFIKESNPKRILVVDADSSDGTKDIVNSIDGVELFISPKRGICFQRNYALSLVETKYIAFIDADDRMSSECLNTLMSEVFEYDLDAIMGISRSYENITYWQKAMDFSLNDSKMVPGPTNMIGQPSIFKMDTVKDLGYDPLLPTNEDTELSRKLEMINAKMRIGSGINYRIHDRTYREVKKKVAVYGRGDAHFVFKFPDRYKNMRHHLLINYPIKKSFHAIKKGGFIYIPFFIMMGLGRYFNMRHFLRGLRREFKDYNEFARAKGSGIC